MKNFIIHTMLILISLLIPNNAYALSTTEATEKIDITKDCNLTLNYQYDDYNFDNTIIKIYHIADITSDFQYQLSSNFSIYPIKINGLKTEIEWELVKQTLNAYIEADNIEATLLQPIQDNTLTITLTPGLYFIKTEPIDTDNYTLLFNSSLLNIPELMEDGSWNYESTIYPKVEEYIPKYEKVNYTVSKQWIDTGTNRPDRINIEIYKDGNLVNKQELSSKNNWTYQWQTTDDGSTWTVVERNIPDNYTVTISTKNHSFTIINKNEDYQDDNPKTEDNIKLYFYLFSGAIISIILLTISIIKQSKNIE